MHGVQTVIGIAAGVASWFYLRDYFWWFVPVVSGVLLSIPLSMLSSSVHLGRLTRKLGLFMTPQERQRPEVLLEFDKAISAPAHDTMSVSAAVREPFMQALHMALLPPDEVLSRRQQHYAQGLMYKSMEEGLHSLSTAEQRELFSRPDSLRELHDLSWSTAEK